MRIPHALSSVVLLSLLLAAGCTRIEMTEIGDPIDSPAPRGERVSWGLLVHGGAGTMSRESMTPEREAAYRAGIEAALRSGHEVLAEGGAAIDAVQAAVRVLEDDSLFNAGRGAVFNSEGGNELDAAIMDGSTLRAGAVAGVTTVRNPIALARAVMDRSDHVFLIGEGAEAFAVAQGFEVADPSWFRTEQRWQQLRDAREAERGNGSTAAVRRGESPNRDLFGTVGAVALDRSGGVAAATSTGGRTNKRWGRVGDVPVIGAGTYANPLCAVSGTGWGEYFIMNAVAHDICARFEYQGLSLREASDKLILEHLPLQADDTGGVIAISSLGEMVWSFNTPGMYRGRIDQDGEVVIGIYREDR